jgi:hypothetical protein
MLPLHASAVGVGDRCAVIMGEPGIGKSTLATALSRRGYLPVADDISAVSASNGVASVHLDLPRMKLAADALQRLGEEQPAACSPGDSPVKYYLEVDRSQPAQRPLPLARVYLLAAADTTTVEVTAMAGAAAKLGCLIDNTYRLPFVNGASARKRHFQLCTAIVEQASFFRVTRPVVSFRLDELADRLTAELEDE